MNTKLRNQAQEKKIFLPGGKQISPEEAMDKLLKTMDKVNTESPDAEANITSMDDNNGGRIIYTYTKEMLAKMGIKIIKKKGLELTKKKRKKKSYKIR